MFIITIVWYCWSVVCPCQNFQTDLVNIHNNIAVINTHHLHIYSTERNEEDGDLRLV